MECGEFSPHSKARAESTRSYAIRSTLWNSGSASEFELEQGDRSVPLTCLYLAACLMGLLSMR